MIDLLYQFVNKGSWRALSFILALLLILSFFLNIQGFATEFRTMPAYWVLLVLWSTIVLWIHGIGFSFKKDYWKILFFPYFAYVIALIALIGHFL